jgi:putative endonuclease
MFYTYILQSLKDGSFYVGYSQDPLLRLEKHNKATSGYTSTKRPWALVYREGFATKTEAIKREKFLKAQKNRDFYLKLIGAVPG